MSKSDVNYDRLTQAVRTAITTSSVPDRIMDEEKLSTAIVKAYFEILEAQNAQAIKARDAWVNKLGPGKRRFFWSLMRIKRENAREGAATGVLLRGGAIILLGAIKWVIRIIYALCIYELIIHFSVSSLILIPLIIMMMVICRVIRMASFEVEEMQDREYLTSIFTSTVAFIALILAAISVFLHK